VLFPSRLHQNPAVFNLAFLTFEKKTSARVLRFAQNDNVGVTRLFQNPQKIPVPGLWHYEHSSRGDYHGSNKGCRQGLRPDLISFTPDGALAYISNRDSKEVWVMDARKHVNLGKIKTGNGAHGVAVVPSPAPKPIARR